MNTSQIETFLILADCLNVTETASRLNCTQPAVSARIRGLEDSLETVLFDRIGKRMYLTRNGEVFLDYARKLLGTLRAAGEHLRQLDDPLQGTIHFGASNFIGIYLIPAFLGRYRKVAPDLQFRLQIATSRQLLELLDSNRLEFVFLSDHIAVDGARLRFQNICRDEMVLVTAPDHPFAKAGRASLSALARETFLIKAAPSATRSFVSDRLAQMGAKLGPELNFSSTEAIKQGVMHGLGVSILSHFTVAHEISAGRLSHVPIDNAWFDRGIRVVMLKDKMLTPAAQKFLASLDFASSQSAQDLV